MCFSQACGAQEIKIAGVLVKLIDQLDVPAREQGTIAQLAVQEGSRVKADDLLMRIDDTEARYAEDRARVEMAVAAQQAASDVAERLAERTLATAEGELRRADEARAKLRNIVTEAEYEKLRLAVDQAKLAVEKAQQDRSVAALQRDLKKVELEFAARQTARHQATAPFAGVIVQVHKRQGDWVEPGDKMLRLIRLDRLRVEGFLDAAQAKSSLEGRPVALTLDAPASPGTAFTGKLIFVSPEIDPINRQVRVLAEIENPTFALQPGSRGTLTIR
ncbi:MAG TPA: efflux RND transporter periplasmic adaptor subunit [Pirellulaceae bacterium]|nr:efflux RND transporter periplasmic adaptor subunit [Pirellulaceae bacterium]